MQNRSIQHTSTHTHTQKNPNRQTIKSWVLDSFDMVGGRRAEFNFTFSVFKQAKELRF